MHDSDTPNPPEARNSFLDEKSFRARTVTLFGAINDKTANVVVRSLLALDDASDAPITVFVSSPGGHVESGDAIHDMLKFIKAPVTIVGTGWVGSAATHVFLAVPKAKRLCLPNTRFLIHQPSGGAGGQATDIAIQAREIVKIRERIASVIAKETGQTIERVRDDIERDYWMSAKEAVEYGLVSKIIERRSEVGR